MNTTLFVIHQLTHVYNDLYKNNTIINTAYQVGDVAYSGEQ